MLCCRPASLPVLSTESVVVRLIPRRAFLLCTALTLAAACGLNDALTPDPCRGLASITPDTTTLSVGASTQLQARGFQSSQGGSCVGTLEYAFSWRSSEPAIATVDDAGVVRAVAAGVVTITASHRNPNLRADARISVGGSESMVER